MIKSFIYLVLLSAAFAQLASEGTEGYFISPHGISRQREVHDALQKIVSRLNIENTTYNHSGITYVAYNFTLQFGYIDSKQVIDIVGNDQVQVSGGKVQVQYIFNFSKTQSGRTARGYATGSVVSDSFNYTKGLNFDNQGHLYWQLVANDRGYKNLTIFNRMRIKRMEPFNETDLSSLEDILDHATVQISPGTVQKQILDKFNSIMPQTLNTTLNSYAIGAQILYSFDHPTRGKLNMTIIHHLYGFSITPEDGYKVIYLTEIKDWPDPVCQGVTVPTKHLSWDFYGGTQNIHLTCLYQEVVEYMQKKGWLDTRLDTSWDCNAFQFYAGDLYDMINNLYTGVSPRQLIEGQCKASPNNLSIKHGRQMQNNVLALSVTYACTGKTRDRNLRSIDVLNFTADVRFLIQPKAQKISLDFSIVGVDVVNMEFRPVGNYFVTNINLALFKAHQVMKKMVGSKVFGTGFPSLAMQHPSTEVQQNFTIYYDVSQRGSYLLEEL